MLISSLDIYVYMGHRLSAHTIYLPIIIISETCIHFGTFVYMFMYSCNIQSSLSQLFLALWRKCCSKAVSVRFVKCPRQNEKAREISEHATC